MTRFLAEQLSTAHWFDQRRTREVLGWTPRVGLDEGFARLARARRSQVIPWWMLGGGLVGGMYVLSQSLVVTTLGVALF